MDNLEARLVTVEGVKVARCGFLSHDGKSQIKALLWTSDSNQKAPKGIIQLVHGMSEHIGRYVDFANYLAGCGYAVCAHDQIGHGFSVADPRELGVMPAVQGRDILVEDVHELRKMIGARYARQIPYFLFGHSMGSFIVRAYISQYGEGLAGAILCGGGNQPPLLSKFANMLSRHLAASKGDDYRSAFIDNLGVGAYSKKIENARTPYDWISTDDAVVDAYIADDLAGFMFSVGGYAALTELTGEVAKASSAAKVPDDLPLFFIAGTLDPVGDFGKGVEAAAELMRQGGVKSVEVKLYEGMRHEILNEPGRQQVYEDVVKWVKAHT